MTLDQREGEEIIHQKDRYQLLVDSIQDYAIFLLDTSGYIETWNKGAEKITGYTADEIIGKHLSALCPPSDIAHGKPDKQLLLAARTGSTEDEDWCVKKDGSRFWADEILTALFNKGGSLIGFAKITRDITDKKRSKHALIAANKLLKHQHIELEALNNVKDEFISLASHQLRTPATGIKQFLGLLLEGYAGNLTIQQSAYIQKAYESNERQIDLVNGLLRTAQVDAGKVNLDKSFVNLRTVIDGVVDGLRDVFDARAQSVTVIEKDNQSDIYIDEPRIRMVIENIIDNASKYTENGGAVTITLSETNMYAQVSIKDTGVGISEKDIKKVFEKFNRIPNKLSDTAGGTGLGLYWAKKIINLHKGTIGVKSAVDEGTEFIIKLPKGLSRA
ncbi:MAG: sensory box protein [Candidatus Saccharibacteria bacterium]|nr:sensory box protein [Candidatus Saccharibacteria bacterium]